MVDDPPGGGFADVLRALTDFFVGDGAIEATLTLITELACVHTPAVMAGITLVVDGKPQTSAFTDPTAPTIDTAQYVTGSGPCLDAFRHGNTYMIPDTRSDDRWPEFSRACTEHGIQSAIAFPLVGRHDPLGALNLYARIPSAFADADWDTGPLFAKAAAMVIANTQAYEHQRDLAENLQKALASRAVIEQAKGVLMARSTMTPDDAFDVLRAASQRENLKLREIAQRIVDRRPPPEQD